MSELQRSSPDDEPLYLNRSVTPLFSDVFLSYSRKDKDFVRRLFEALKASSRKSWVDWQDIPPTADFPKQIYTGIEAASTFVFVLSPDSITPESFSLKELDYALQNKKRIIPLVYRMVDPQNVQEELQKLDWIFFTQDELFDYAFRRLLFALDIDVAYWNELAKLLTYAKEWERHGKDSSKLLRGKGQQCYLFWTLIPNCCISYPSVSGRPCSNVRGA
jgi:hypothetical protein